MLLEHIQENGTMTFRMEGAAGNGKMAPNLSES